MKALLGKFAAMAAIAFLPSLATAANLFANPSFEAGPVGYGALGWIAFGNTFTEAITPLSGNQVNKQFGNFNGGFNVTGIFQEFPATPSTIWELDVWSRHNTGDNLVGSQQTGGNWVVQKIVFKDAGDVEIGANESTILDGTFPLDTWIDNAPIQAVAPAGTVQVEAFVLYLQPLFDPGAVLIDDARFEQVPEPTGLALLAAGLLLMRRR